MDAIKNTKRTQDQIYNIGSGMKNSFSLLELFKYLENILSIAMKPVKNKPRISDQKVFVANTSKAKQEFGWNAKVLKEKGVDKMYKWIEKLNNFGKCI